MKNNVINLFTGLIMMGTFYLIVRKTIFGKIIRMLFATIYEILHLTLLLINLCFNKIKNMNSNLENNIQQNNTGVDSFESNSKEDLEQKQKTNVINIANDEKKDTKNKWKIGDNVKIGFMKLKLIDITKDGYILTNNENQKYQFIPYKGLKKII